MKVLWRLKGYLGKPVPEQNSRSLKNENVDPVVCWPWGQGQSIVDELHGEKIDIIKWDKDTSEFISNALSPQKY